MQLYGIEEEIVRERLERRGGRIIAVERFRGDDWLHGWYYVTK